MTFYTEPQRLLQEQFDCVDLADRIELAIVGDELDEVAQEFIASRDFFFLSTVDGDGWPTVSYKGGPVGLVAVVGPTELAFPNYDGNSMFLSMGNIVDTAKVGMLFIDFETPNRVRVAAEATVSADDPLLGRWPGATLVVRVRIRKAWVNCARYIHKHERVGASPYVPAADGSAPLPSWKRIDGLNDVLPAETRSEVDAEGGVITMEEYAAKLMAGES